MTRARVSEIGTLLDSLSARGVVTNAALRREITRVRRELANLERIAEVCGIACRTRQTARSLTHRVSTRPRPVPGRREHPPTDGDRSADPSGSSLPPLIEQQFVESVLPLIQRKAHTKSRQSGAPVDDLVQAAAMECWRQLPRFDAARGVKLTTWLQHRIDGAMKDYLRDSGYFLHGGRRSSRKEQRFTLDARWPNGRPIIDTEDVTSADLLRRRQSLDRFHELLQPLSQRERIVMLMRFRDDRRMKDIGDSLGLSESRVSQLISSVLARLEPVAKRRLARPSPAT